VTLGQKVANTSSWLFHEPRHFWLCILVCAAAIAVVVRNSHSEPTIRWIGLLLQLFGIVTVAWGIVKTRQFFGMKPLTETFLNWLSRFPFRRRTTIVGIGAAVAGNASLSSRGHSSWPIDPTAPLEQRLSTLEKNLPLLHDRITNVQNEFDRTSQLLRDQLRSETAHRELLSEELHARLQTFGTSGLHISAIGAAWLFLGVVLATGSLEIKSFLN
jgi:hypothetical protein